jgi:hypothetical protein
VLQGYGYGAEDVAELVPSIEKYYGENVKFGMDQAKYTPVSELDYDYQTFYTLIQTIQCLCLERIKINSTFWKMPLLAVPAIPTTCSAGYSPRLPVH